MAQDEDPVIPVAGFGFFPESFYKTFREMTKSLDDMEDTRTRNQGKCDILKLMVEGGFTPPEVGIGPFESQRCEAMWDGASCFPETLANETRQIPCMESFLGVFYHSSGRKIFKFPAFFRS